MNTLSKDNAIVYCEGAYNTTNGKTAHGLVRFTERFKILSVIDSRHAGKDAGLVLDNKGNGIPIHASFKDAFQNAVNSDINVAHFVIGLAPDGGRLPDYAREAVKSAIKKNLNVCMTSFQKIKK